MIRFGDQLNDEEIWAIIQYERSFSGAHGGMGPRHGRDDMGPGGNGCCAGQDLHP